MVFKYVPMSLVSYDDCDENNLKSKLPGWYEMDYGR